MTPSIADRSARQRQAILTAAAEIFSEKGYRGTVTDEIAARAAVSKQTLYKHFPTKEQLFADVVIDTAETIDDLVRGVSNPEHVTDLDAELRTLARKFIKALIRPEVLQMRRLVIAEADRFPDLGKTLYERGPDRFVATFGPWLRQLAGRGLLRPLDDPELAAHHFGWMVLSVPWNRVMFCGSGETFSEDELLYFADKAVDAFTTGYGIDR